MTVKQQLICPCGKQVYPEIEYGVLVFKHQGSGNYCAHMNKFDTSVETLAYRKVKKALKEVDAEEFVFLMSGSSACIDAFCKDLSKGTEKYIHQLLKRLYEVEKTSCRADMPSGGIRSIIFEIDSKFRSSAFMRNYASVGSTVLRSREEIRFEARQLRGKHDMILLEAACSGPGVKESMRGDLNTSFNHTINGLRSRGGAPDTANELKKAIKQLEKVQRDSHNASILGIF